MQLRQVGTTGLWVSEVGLGCNNFGMRIDVAASKEVVHAALDSGITYFDTAESYGRTDHVGASEEYLAAGLGRRRDEVVIATKFGSPSFPSAYPCGGSRRYVLSAVEASLRRLNTDYIDLYYLHYWDPLVPIDETLGVLDDLVHAGKVRYTAVSNLEAWQLVEAHHRAERAGRTTFAAVQAEWSLLRRGTERDMVPAATHLGVGVVPFFPLASGMLTGKYRRGEAPPPGTRLAELERFRGSIRDTDWGVVERLSVWAGERGTPLSQVAIAWLLGQRQVASVIAGATTAEQVRSNAAAATVVLSPEDLAELDELSLG